MIPRPTAAPSFHAKGGCRSEPGQQSKAQRSQNKQTPYVPVTHFPTYDRLHESYIHPGIAYQNPM